MLASYSWTWSLPWVWLMYSISLHWKQTDFLSQHLPVVNSFLSWSGTLCSHSLGVLSGLSLCKSCACCCLCEFVCTFALFCLRRQLFSWGHLPPLTPRIFLPPLFHASLNLDGRGMIQISHSGLSIPKSLTLCTLITICFKEKLLW